MVVKMRKLLGTLLLLALVGYAGAQEIWVAPSIVREDAPVIVHVDATKIYRVMVFDKFGNLAFDKEFKPTEHQGMIEWWGETNGGRKVDSGQYKLIVLEKDPSGYFAKKLDTWIAVFR